MKKLLFSLGILVLIASVGFAASFDGHQVTLIVSQIAALTMNADDDIILTIEDDGTLVGGALPPSASDSTQYLQYTLINPVGMLLRKVQVSANAGAPTGTTLTVLASGVVGVMGTPQPAATVSAVAVDLIRDISSCATGIGATSGAQLSYTFALASIGTVAVGSTALAVLYTIMDQ